MDKPHNPIRFAALVAVAVIGLFIMWMDWRSSNILSSPDWCARAIGADKADANSHVDAAASCIGLLTIQLKGIVTDSHIRAGVEAFCLLVLVVIVIAGGRLSFTANKTGVGANMASATDAADKVAGAAVDAATEVHAETGKVGVTPEPTYNGPAMPPPKGG